MGFDHRYLIFNPVSGQGNAEDQLATIQTHLSDQSSGGAPLQVLQTTPETSAEDLTRIALQRGADCVIASGGDGTVSEVAGALVGTEVPMGIVPRGTANAIAAGFDISDNIIEACKVINTGVAREIDLACCNDRPFVLLAGIGLEADIVSQANRQLKDRIGSAAYILSAFREVREIKRFQVEMETPDRIIRVEAAGVTVANVAPATSVLAQGASDVVPFDGLLDVTIFAPEGTGGAIAASYNLFKSAVSNNPVEREDVGYFRCESLVLKADPPQNIVLDGEIVGKTPVSLRCIPKGLKLLTPEHSSIHPHEKLAGLPGLTIEEKPSKAE